MSQNTDNLNRGYGPADPTRVCGSELGAAPGALPDCECLYWARDGRAPITQHHPRCEKYDPAGESVALVRRLRKGIDAWAGDENGVHPQCWDAYRAALLYLGDLAALATVEAAAANDPREPLPSVDAMLEARHRMKLGWVEPWPACGPEGNDIYAHLEVRATVHDCVSLQRAAVRQRGGDTMGNDARHLLDFMAVHWATLVEEANDE